jgi:hypothetical protein
MEQFADGAGVDADDCGNFAVAEAVGTEVEAVALLGREVFDGAVEQGEPLLFEGEGFGGLGGDGGEIEGEGGRLGFGVAGHGEIVSDGVDPGAGILDGGSRAEGGVIAEEGFVGMLLGFVGADAEGEEVSVDLLAALFEEGADLGMEGMGHSSPQSPEGCGRVVGRRGCHR